MLDLVVQTYRSHISDVSNVLICAFLAIYGGSLFEMLAGAVKKWHGIWRFLVFLVTASLGMALFSKWGVDLVKRFLWSQPPQTSLFIALGAFLALALFARGKGYY